MNNDRPTLSPSALRLKLRRELRGSADPNQSNGEHLLVQLVNRGEHQKARELLTQPDAAIGPDLAACVKPLLDGPESEGRRDKPYMVPWPPDVWDFYAQQAREQGLSIRAALIDAVRRDRDRILRARRDAAEPRAPVLDAMRALRDHVDALRQAVEARAAAQAAGPPHDVRVLTEGVDELKEHARQQGTALAAMLMVLDAKGWIPKRLAEQLRKQKWL
jgi:hypothetical protein